MGIIQDGNWGRFVGYRSKTFLNFVLAGEQSRIFLVNFLYFILLYRCTTASPHLSQTSVAQNVTQFIATILQPPKAAAKMGIFFCKSREYWRRKYHCTADLLFDWFGISCMATDSYCFYSQNRLIQTRKTGDQWYSDTSPFSIPWQILWSLAVCSGCIDIYESWTDQELGLK